MFINKDFPGFFNIPGFSQYVISPDGKVINTTTGEMLKGSTNPAGYHHYRLKSDSGKIKTIGRHRLMCMTFVQRDEWDSLVVNHINGVKGDDRLVNLEWATYTENAEHAGRMGLTSKCCPVDVKSLDTGEILKFPSAKKCAEYFGLSKDAVLYRLKQPSSRVYPERMQYRISANEPWPDPENIESAVLENGRARSILLRDVWTKEIRWFPKLSGLARYLNVSPATITKWINLPNNPVLPGGIQLKLAADCTPWVEYDDPYLEMSKFSGTRYVEVFDSFTGTNRIYSSLKECAQDRNLAMSVAHYRVKTNGRSLFSDGCYYGYYPLKHPGLSGPTK